MCCFLNRGQLVPWFQLAPTGGIKWYVGNHFTSLGRVFINPAVVQSAHAKVNPDLVLELNVPVELVVVSGFGCKSLQRPHFRVTKLLFKLAPEPRAGRLLGQERAG